MDGADLSVANRLKVFSEFLPPLAGEQLSFLRLAIDWRNRRVHSLATEMLRKSDEQTLLASAKNLALDHSGLNIVELLRRFKSGEAPSFKDAASVISLVHKAVAHFDGELLSRLDIERYIRDALRTALFESGVAKTDIELKRVCAKTWGDPRKRRVKALRALRWVGVHETTQITGREVPEGAVDKIADMTPEQAWFYLHDS